MKGYGNRSFRYFEGTSIVMFGKDPPLAVVEFFFFLSTTGKVEQDFPNLCYFQSVTFSLRRGCMRIRVQFEVISKGNC